MRRHPSIRAFESGDSRFLWLLHRLGRLNLEFLKPVIEAKPTPEEFKEAVQVLMPEVYDYAWILISKREVGICFGLDCWRYILLGDVIWLPWATPRQRVETMVEFCKEIGRHKPAQFYFREPEKHFGLYLCRLGIARRIGTSESLGGERLFETRKV